MKDRTKIAKRIQFILDIACSMAERSPNSTQILNRIFAIDIHSNGYGEPGYPGYPNKPVIVAIGNWNEIIGWNHKSKKVELVSNLPKRLYRIFDRLGVECEWSDEWTVCTRCDKLVRTVDDSYYWKPSYILIAGNCVCKKCSK